MYSKLKLIISVMLLQLFIGVTLLQASPSIEDTTIANELLYTLESDQTLHFKENSYYQSVTARIYKGLIYQSCAYSTFNGKGFIATVSKVENGKVWNIEKHVGQDNTIAAAAKTSWTCMNCNGENYEIVKTTNEHGLCNL